MATKSGSAIKIISGEVDLRDTYEFMKRNAKQNFYATWCGQYLEFDIENYFEKEDKLLLKKTIQLQFKKINK